MLLQLRTASPVLLQTISRPGAFLQTAEQKLEERDAFDLPCRPLSQYSYAEEESWYDGAEEVHSEAEKGEW